MVSVKGQAMLQFQPSKTRSDKLDNNSTTVQKSDRRTPKAAKAGKVAKAGKAAKASKATVAMFILFIGLL